jgi:hypothetical protein
VADDEKYWWEKEGLGGSTAEHSSSRDRDRDRDRVHRDGYSSRDRDGYSSRDRDRSPERSSRRNDDDDDDYYSSGRGRDASREARGAYASSSPRY